MQCTLLSSTKRSGNHVFRCFRAAAYRSRQKRKRWVTNLEAKTTAMNTANKMLTNEVIALRNEVAQLKLQLLAHRDCPVTLAMCQQSNTGNLQIVKHVHKDCHNLSV